MLWLIDFFKFSLVQYSIRDINSPDAADPPTRVEESHRQINTARTTSASVQTE